MSGKDKKTAPAKDKPKRPPSRPAKNEGDEDSSYQGDFVTPRKDDHGDDDEPLE